jgi:signal transduction histidine kinase
MIQTGSRDLTADKKKRSGSPFKRRELNELRTNLVSTISHEFRTPMTTIRASGTNKHVSRGQNI